MCFWSFDGIPAQLESFEYDGDYTEYKVPKNAQFLKLKILDCRPTDIGKLRNVKSLRRVYVHAQIESIDTFVELMAKQRSLEYLEITVLSHHQSVISDKIKEALVKHQLTAPDSKSLHIVIRIVRDRRGKKGKDDKVNPEILKIAETLSSLMSHRWKLTVKHKGWGWDTDPILNQLGTEYIISEANNLDHFSVTITSK